MIARHTSSSVQPVAARTVPVTHARSIEALLIRV
ncbi:hypothetical protein Bra471DRAFT_01023 [Bradyrhizobium sp. WSM471]|nr:hypothetical protein Bra471DRAFT_01023 [Bradyrhizobium sp. WSM471]